MELENKVRELRQKRGLSVAELASAVGIARQSVYLLEAGSYIPNTLVALKLAGALGVKVEELFPLAENKAQPLRSQAIELLSEDVQTGQALQLCRVNGRLVATPSDLGTWGLPAADAIMLDSGCRAGEQVKSKARILGDEAEIDRRVLMAGCDPGAAILAQHLRRSGVELVVAYQNSSRALELLQRGLIHIAGTHIRDEETGESNLPKIHQMFGKDSVAVISFALWEEGIAVLQGNPKEIRSVADFTRPEVRIANREPGAGSRILLDSLLEQQGIGGNLVNGYDCVVTGHLPSARQLLTGQADCCINISSAARLFGLGFIPLVSKRYDLVVYRKHLKLSQVQAVFDTLSRAACRRDLENIGGYEMRTAGDRLL